MVCERSGFQWEVPVSLDRCYPGVIAGWFVTLAAVLCTRLALGVPATSASVVSLAFLPALIALTARAGAPRTPVPMVYDTARAIRTTAPRRVRTSAADEADAIWRRP